MAGLRKDFALLFEAFAGAFSALVSMVRSCCEPHHYAGWR
jgi:hypothetical protein